MSWGAFNICSEGHAIYRNIDAAAGATIGVRYPYEFDGMGMRFWATPMGAVFDHGRLARSFYPTSWLYERDESPSPDISFYHKDPTAGGDPWQIDELNGYDVSPDGDYFATFKNQCDRLWIGQNAEHYWNSITGYRLKIGTGTWLRPAKVLGSNMLADPNHYKQRPFMPPTLPHEDYANTGDWPNLQTKRGMREWVKDGWAYKKATAVYHDHSMHEFVWDDNTDPEWETASWDVSPNPTDGLDLNLLYLVEKRYSHGPDCDGTHDPFTARNCNDRILTGYRPHYWCKTAPVPQQFDSSSLLKSWCVDDGYPYLDSLGGVGNSGWPPYSISCGKTAFERFKRTLVHNKSHADEPYYAKTDLHDSHETSPATIARYDALCEYIPPNTAFDLIIYLQVVNYVICERALSGTWPNKYHAKVDSGYFNTKCYCILHQIAPLQPKP